MPARSKHVRAMLNSFRDGRSCPRHLFPGSLFGPGGQSLDELFCSDEETSHRRLDITYLQLLVQRRVWRCTLTLRDDV